MSQIRVSLDFFDVKVVLEDDRVCKLAANQCFECNADWFTIDEFFPYYCPYCGVRFLGFRPEGGLYHHLTHPSLHQQPETDAPSSGRPET